MKMSPAGRRFASRRPLCQCAALVIGLGACDASEPVAPATPQRVLIDVVAADPAFDNDVVFTITSSTCGDHVIGLRAGGGYLFKDAQPCPAVGTTYTMSGLTSFAVTLEFNRVAFIAGTLTGSYPDWTATFESLLTVSVHAVQDGELLNVPAVVAAITNVLNGLVSTGVITSGNANALGATIAQAAAQIDNGQTNAAVNALNAFKRQVDALERSGRLTATQAAALRAYADQLIAQA